MTADKNSAPSSSDKPQAPASSASSTTPSRHVDLVGQEIGGCIILEKIAEGGMGTVFKAKHKALDRIVCVKVLSPALANDKKAVGLFLTEARAIAEIDHPNIVFVYNVGKEKGYHFIVMSFIEGESLSSIVRRRPNLPLSFIADAFCGILQGLEAAHQKGIIHRDIKPSNILINKKLEPKIVDFGIAKKMDKDKGVAKTTELAGTAYFISPEQALGKPIDARTDLYALGASLFYVLTGKYPFTGKNSMDIIQKHINTPVPDILTYRSNIPAWLVTAVNKLMAKKPADRFQSAQEALLFFKKSREDEKLALNKGLNISEEVGLRLSKAEEPANAANKRSNLPPVRRYSDDVPTIRKSQRIQVFMPTLEETKKAKYSKGKGATLTTPSKNYLKTLRSFIKKSSLSVAFVGLMLITSAAIFLKLGSLVALFNAQNSQMGNIIFTLTRALLDPMFVSQNMMILSLAIIFIVLLLSMAFFKLIKKSVPIIFVIAVISYLTGVFELTQSSTVISFTGPVSLLIYSFLCAALAIKLNEKTTFPLPVKILSVFLFICGFILVYKFAEPSNAMVGHLTVMIFYVLFALCSAACVSLLFNANAFMRMLSAILFMAALIAVFFYQVSGNFYYLKTQLEDKAFLPVIEEQQRQAREQQERERALALEKALAMGQELPVQEQQAPSETQEQPQTLKRTVMITLNEQPEELLYKIYSSKDITPQLTDNILWRYVIREPFNSLKDYKENGEIMLIIVALILYGFLAYVIDVFAYKEEKWTLI